MISMTVVSALILLAGEATEPRWTLDGRGDGVLVFRRAREGSAMQEFKATGMIDAPPEAVWNVLVRFDDYKRFTPYAERTEVIQRDQEGGKTHLYVLTSPPLISKRDYAVRYQEEPATGSGERTLRWEISEQSPPENAGVVRIKTFEGYWKIEPRSGNQTFATYYLFTDPGGAIPAWVINKLAGPGMRDLFLNIRRTAADAKQAPVSGR